MDTKMKPILHYTETISNLWPDSICESLEHFVNDIDQLPSKHELIKEFNLLIGGIYQEGFKDGLELCHWLENGAMPSD